MTKWDIKQSAHLDTYYLFQEGKIYIWFQKIKIDEKYIWFYDREISVACYLKDDLPQYIIDELKTLPQVVK